jgi:2-amino-4-hydroxy-6-hydroxymethyldihydropteridine diphosphokinase
LGDSREILRIAIARLATVLKDIRVSSLYLTEPRDVIDQPRFFNMAVSGYYSGTAIDLLSELHGIETLCGRNRSQESPKGPRTLDIDIELFGDKLIREDGLVIPHERLTERQFVLVPLLELDGEAVNPASGEAYREICQRLPDQGVIKAGAL